MPNNTEFTENTISLTDDLAQERILDLSDMADEPGGALSPGWYSAEVLEGYATRSGKQFLTEDSTSKDGASHNLRICFKVNTLKGDARNLQTSFNYRVSDFTPERVQHIKQLREDMKGVQGRWPDADAQRTSLAIAKIGQFGKATKIGVPLSAENVIVPAKFFGVKLDIRVAIDANGYNEVKEYAEAGTKAPRSKA